MTALQTLLHQIVDYAGLFPPATLPLPDVIRNYERYVPGHHNWMLARLIVPAARLSEFATVYGNLPSAEAEQPVWKISALIPPVNAGDGAFDSAINAIQSFNETCSFATVDTVEGKLPSSDLIAESCEKLKVPNAFLEIPWQDPNETIHQLAAVGQKNVFAKIRTGGVTPDLIPDVERVANFIHQCATSNLGFKATAGLHHPLKGRFALTYDADAEQGTMHGFMNVFLAACFAKQKDWSVEQLSELLQHQDAGSFAITDDRISFQESSLSTDEIRQVRETFAISFGSCSFIEPVEDLIQIGWLADAAKTV